MTAQDVVNAGSRLWDDIELAMDKAKTDILAMRDIYKQAFAAKMVNSRQVMLALHELDMVYAKLSEAEGLIYTRHSKDSEIATKAGAPVNDALAVVRPLDGGGGR